MTKRVFVLLTLVVAALLVVMVLTKPDPWKHQAEVRKMALNVASQEMANMKLPEKYAKHLPEEYANMELPEEYAQMGTNMVMDAAGRYLQSNMHVDDYVVLSVGMVNYHGQTLPITVGAFGKVFVLADEEDVSHVIK